MSQMLIGGEWRQAAAHDELEVVNPATEEVVDTVPAGSTEDVELAVATAKEFGLTLVGFARCDRCTVYSGQERVPV